MIQEIEQEQLAELNAYCYETLETWAKARGYQGVALVKWKDGMMKGKRVPLLTIGQMIEFLGNIKIEQGEDGKWVLLTQENRYRGEELIFLLWEGVKFKLLNSING